ncbi:MAG: PAS domain S-box protein [Geobacteraceae bacterium]|nr:PAS domain S-box protein [Geobacteraceae bacterium]
MTPLDKLTEEQLLRELQESERRFAALADQVPVGIFETDPKGDCLFVNDRWCAIAGAFSEQAHGRGWLLFIHPDDQELVATEWYAAARENREFSLEYRFLTPSGRVTWVVGSAKAKVSETGEVIGYLGTVQDITKQKKDQEEIQRLNADLEQRVMERTAQLSRLSVENDKKLQELSSLYRMSNTMLSTMRLNKLVHLILAALTSGDNPFFDRAMLFLLNERSAIMQGMLGVTRLTSAGLINPVAEVENLLASRWDISEADMQRQQDSEFSCQVRASRLELDKARNMASRAVLEKRLIHVADTAREKRLDREFVRRFAISSCAIAPLMAKEQVVGVIIVDNALSGKVISTDDLRFLQLVTNQAGMAIENTILYNRIEDANRSLREARERLVQGERLSTIGEMAASIAHEIKGPLVSIGGFARRLERKLPADSNEHNQAATIVREVRRLEKLLTDILSFVRKTTICYAPCDLTDLVEESLAIIAPTLDEKGITVVKGYPRKAISLLGDGQQLKQVFLNLFVNAEDARRGGGSSA